MKGMKKSISWLFLLGNSFSGMKKGNPFMPSW
jgi:hypothetical protein